MGGDAAPVGATLGREARTAALQARFDEALQRWRDATPRSALALRGLIPMPEGGGLEFDPTCDEPMMLPPQVTEMLVRGDVTVMIGDPNVGKSQLLSATAMAIAYNAVAELLGEAGDGWLGPALFASNEERPAYVRARWKVLVKKLPEEKRKIYDKLGHLRRVELAVDLDDRRRVTIGDQGDPIAPLPDCRRQELRRDRVAHSDEAGAADIDRLRGLSDRAVADAGDRSQSSYRRRLAAFSR
jgi:hypothetical protein